MVIKGDALTVLRTFKSESINCIITSPPYWGLRDYGTATWKGGNKNCTHANAKKKSRYDYSLKSSPIQDGNRKGTDAPRWKNICPDCGAKKIDFQLGLEPTFHEYVMRLCGIFDEAKRVLKRDGTCWVNLGDTYSIKKGKVFLPSKCLCQIPSRFAIEMCNRGWILRNEIIWYKPNCMPSSIKDRFTVDFEKMFFFVKNKKYRFETQYEPMSETTINDSRFGKEVKTENTKDFMKANMGNKSKDPAQTRRSFKNLINKPGRNKRTVWKITTKPFKEAHFAVFPEELIETPIKAGCPIGGTVLDIFCGSGTTGVVAEKFSRKFIGIELNPNYIKIANKRIDQERRLF